jgi:hypothetical protein
MSPLYWECIFLKKTVSESFHGTWFDDFFGGEKNHQPTNGENAHGTATEYMAKKKKQ